MIQVIQLKGKEKYLYRLMAPLVMDPEVIRANNNYPFRTSDCFIWFIALENQQVLGFVPVEQKNGKKAIINNYYINADGDRRIEVLSELLSSIISCSNSEGWMLNSVTLMQDKEIFEKFEFSSLDKRWTRYVKMLR